MAKGSGGISGLGVALATLAGLLVYSGIRGQNLLVALRSIAAGKPIPDAPAVPTRVAFGADTSGSSAPPPSGGGGGTVTVSAPTALNGRIVSAARKYIGIPYKINGATPSGFDCSGLVTWVLHVDCGLNLPSNSHTVTGQFLTWSGAQTISRDQCQAGDLVCWLGHIAIATSPTRMIAAPTLGRNVLEENIYWSPSPTIRRVKPQGGTVLV